MEGDKFLIEYDGDRYDIVDFLRNHPGGFNYVEGSRDRNIETRMINSKHSKSAFYLLREYKLGGRNESNASGNEDLEVRSIFFCFVFLRFKFQKKL